MKQKSKYKEGDIVLAYDGENEKTVYIVSADAKMYLVVDTEENDNIWHCHEDDIIMIII